MIRSGDFLLCHDTTMNIRLALVTVVCVAGRTLERSHALVAVESLGDGGCAVLQQAQVARVICPHPHPYTPTPRFRPFFPFILYIL